MSTDNDTTWQLVKGQEVPYQQMNSDVANRTIEKLRNSE